MKLFWLVSIAFTAIGLGAIVVWDFADLFPVSLIFAAIMLVLILIAVRRKWGKERRWIVVDGSNVLYWNNDIPRLETVREVAQELVGRGFSPLVVFDANAGYKVAGRYLNERALSRSLRLPANWIHVVHKSTPADPFILKVAIDLGTRIVTNDRYRDWIDLHPEILGADFLIKGRYRNGALVLSGVMVQQTAPAP